MRRRPTHHWYDDAWKGIKTVGETVAPFLPLLGLKKGGKVNKTGPYYLHKGERALNARQTKAYDAKKKATRKSRKTGTKRKNKK